ncbi:glycoside hydrolase superfamily [Crepidotus variabilis]|uniref:Glycoside hydrolase superfamily n=1 Tax=Crepidotus variabilis TaxID=179855 RepID=A0A9P6EHL3_9AGAR|nr:glycoside hydrolase superfamily [Crepidotus variabilis]
MPNITVSEQYKREVGQHLVVGFHGTDVSSDIKTLIQDYFVGSVILMKRNIKNAKQTQLMVQNLQQLARDASHERPLLIGIDQENGLVSAFSSPTAGTQFPGAMALASAGPPEIAERVSAASAAELKMVGINWVYSPVADVNTDPQNPVIGVRSFGEDPAEVAKYTAAVVRGHAASGVASTAKHFPGHGDTHVDSHLALPVISKTKERLYKEELVPFKPLVEKGIPSIMTGHMALPLVTGNEDPCSLSKVITALLREEMGYKGLIVTDCLEMDAISEPKQGGCGTEEGTLRAIQAGADVAMICHTFSRQKGAIERLYLALVQGRLDYDLLKASGERVKKLKAAFTGDWESCLDKGSGWEDRFEHIKSQNQMLSKEMYLKTAKVIWNSGQVLPLKSSLFVGEKQLLLLTPEVEAVNRAVDSGDGTVVGAGDGVVRNTAGPSFLTLANELGKRVKKLKHIVYGRKVQTSGVVSRDIGAVVFLLRNADLRRWQLDFLDALELKNAGIPVVLVSSCGPYDLCGLEGTYKDWTGYVCTYEFTGEGLVGSLVAILSDL